jgi:hypothetical protein
MVATQSKPQLMRMTEFGSPLPKRVEGKTITNTKQISSSKMTSPSDRKKAKPSPKVVSPASSPDQVVLRSSQVSPMAPQERYLDLHILPCKLRPSATLTTSQCFHWRVVELDDAILESPGSAWSSHDATEWIGILHFGKDHSVVVSLKETPETTVCRILFAPQNIDVQKDLYDYFQLGEPLTPLYQKWAQEDPKCLARIAKCLPGVCIIEQYPWECLVSFICSINSNIPHITKILLAIRQ